MIISKIHGIISFDQSPWLEKCIDYNSKKRAEADSDFKKDYDKGLSTSFFGKTMEDVRNRIRMEIKNTDEKKIYITNHDCNSMGYAKTIKIKILILLRKML